MSSVNLQIEDNIRAVMVMAQKHLPNLVGMLLMIIANDDGRTAMCAHGWGMTGEETTSGLDENDKWVKHNRRQIRNSNSEIIGVICSTFKRDGFSPRKINGLEFVAAELFSGHNQESDSKAADILATAMRDFSDEWVGKPVYLAGKVIEAHAAPSVEERAQERLRNTRPDASTLPEVVAFHQDDLEDALMHQEDILVTPDPHDPGFKGEVYVRNLLDRPKDEQTFTCRIDGVSQAEVWQIRDYVRSRMKVNSDLIETTIRSKPLTSDEFDRETNREREESDRRQRANWNAQIWQPDGTTIKL